MDAYERHALADRELRLGLVDPDLMNVAIGEANGISSLARQIYLERRVRKMNEEAINNVSAYFIDLQAQLELTEKKMIRRCKLEGWTWVIVCFGSVTTGTIFLFFAGSISKPGDPRIVRYALLAGAFIVIGIASFIKVKRVEQRESALSR